MNLVAIPASLLFLTDTLQEENIYCNLNFSNGKFAMSKFDSSLYF